VNENVEDEAVKIEPLSTDNIQVSGNPTTILTAVSPQILENPTTILTAVSPQILENPLFAEFRKITVISLKSPTGFQANQFENSIVEALKNRVTVADTKFIWETEGGLRKLKIPMLGWEIGYLFKDGKLFVANSFEFLESFVSAKTKQSGKANFNDLTVIRLQNHEANFEQIIQKLAVKNDDFFVGNIESLLAVIGDVKQVEIRKKNEGLILREEISALFQQTVVP
jgi:hypothetical protein